jgi:hypothetical protein
VNIAKYTKFIAAIVGFVVVVGQVAADGIIDAADAGVIVTAAVTAAAVFGFKNKPAAPPEG